MHVWNFVSVYNNPLFPSTSICPSLLYLLIPVIWKILLYILFTYNPILLSFWCKQTPDPIVLVCDLLVFCLFPWFTFVSFWFGSFFFCWLAIIVFRCFFCICLYISKPRWILLLTFCSGFPGIQKKVVPKVFLNFSLVWSLLLPLVTGKSSSPSYLICYLVSHWSVLSNVFFICDFIGRLTMT